MTLAADVTEPLVRKSSSAPSELLLWGREEKGEWQGEGEDLPRQHHVVRVIFAPLPVFAGVDGKVKRQHLVLRVSERNHN